MKHLLLTTIAAVVLVGCVTNQVNVENDILFTQKPKRVLFIGNSFTYSHEGLWEQLKTLSDSMNPKLGYKTSRVVKGGASLEVMWKNTKAVEVIAKGGWDVVVLQEDIPETTIDSFRTYSRMFVKAVREVGARPILFMAWEYDRLGWISMNEIAEAHKDMSSELNVDVAPVGLAWSNSRSIKPDLDMYRRDREHPSIAGMYLSLIVIEATISRADPLSRNPEKLPIRSFNRLDSDNAWHLRQVASKTIQMWQSSLEPLN
jgi:hypothetical protein